MCVGGGSLQTKCHLVVPPVLLCRPHYCLPTEEDGVYNVCGCHGLHQQGDGNGDEDQGVALDEDVELHLA